MEGNKTVTVISFMVCIRCLLFCSLRGSYCAHGVLAFALFTATQLSWLLLLLLLNTADIANLCACWCSVICSGTGRHYTQCFTNDSLQILCLQGLTRQTFVTWLLMSFLVSCTSGNVICLRSHDASSRSVI